VYPDRWDRPDRDCGLTPQLNWNAPQALRGIPFAPVASKARTVNPNGRRRTVLASNCGISISASVAEHFEEALLCAIVWGRNTSIFIFSAGQK
jgi:hypothetical protein